MCQPRHQLIKRKLPIALTAGVLLLASLALAVHSVVQKPLWGCVARIKLEKILAGDEAYNPTGCNNNSIPSRTSLMHPQSRRRLARASQSARQVFPSLDFAPSAAHRWWNCASAETSNAVWQVTQAAGGELADFYTTNQPKVLLKCVDMGNSFPPKPWWKRAVGGRDGFSDVSAWK